MFSQPLASVTSGYLKFHKHIVPEHFWAACDVPLPQTEHKDKTGQPKSWNWGTSYNNKTHVLCVVGWGVRLYFWRGDGCPPKRPMEASGAAPLSRKTETVRNPATRILQSWPCDAVTFEGSRHGFSWNHERRDAFELSGWHSNHLNLKHVSRSPGEVENEQLMRGFSACSASSNEPIHGGLGLVLPSHAQGLPAISSCRCRTCPASASGSSG